MVTDETRVQMGVDVTFQSLGSGQETVILALKSGWLYTCNETTASFLRAADGKRTMREITELLLNEFQVPRAKLQADLLALAERLVSEELVVVAPAES